MFSGLGLSALAILYSSIVIIGAIGLRFLGLAAEYDDQASLRIYYGLCALLVFGALLMMILDYRQMAQAMSGMGLN